MARPISKGVDYFPLDVGFLADIKVQDYGGSQIPSDSGAYIHPIQCLQG